MTKAIIATDISFHGALMTEFNSIKGSYDESNANHRQNLVNMLLHASDISNPTLEFSEYREWAFLVCEEFR